MATSTLVIQPIVLDPADFPPLPLQPGFLDLVNQTLGFAATPLDGIDQLIGELIDITEGLDAALQSMDADLTDTFLEAFTIDPTPVAGTLVGYGGALPASDAAVNDLGTLLSGAALGTPPAPCDLNVALPDTVLGGAPASYTLGIHNGTAAAITINAVTFRTPSPDILAVSVPAPQTVLPPGEIAGSITVTPARSGDFTATLELTVAGATRNTVICYRARVAQSTAGVGAGGGGGGGAGGGPGVPGGIGSSTPRRL